MVEIMCAFIRCFGFGSQRWGGVHVIDWFLMILHQGKWIWMVWLVIIWLLSHASAMGSDLLCFCRNLLILLRVGPVWSVLQIPSDSVARISQVLSVAALIQFGTSVAGVFSWLVQVIVVRWWIVESLNVLCFYTRSLEIGQWSEHCFTPAWLSYKSWWSLCWYCVGCHAVFNGAGSPDEMILAY